MTLPLGVAAQGSHEIRRFPATLELARTAEAEVQTLATNATGAGYPAHGQLQEHASNGKQVGRGAMRGAVAATEDVKVFEFSIVHGKLGDEEQTIQATEGEIVEFRWSSDEELNLHMHGYKIEVDVAPDSPATMRVHASKTGRFPVLNHDGNPPSVLLYLEVLVPAD